MSRQRISNLTGTVKGRLLALVILPKVLNLSTVQQMRVVRLFDNINNVIRIDFIGRSEDHPATKHDLCRSNCSGFLHSLFLGVTMQF